MKWKKGDILVSIDGEKEVLGVMDNLYVMSCIDNFELVDGMYLEQELINLGYDLPVPKKMHLGTTESSLYIWYDNVSIGYIDEDGECRILNSNYSIQNHNQWRKDGCLIDSTIIEWNDSEYELAKSSIGSIVLRKAGVIDGVIYNFHYTRYEHNCNDDNIIRHKHNNCPIGF